MRRGRGNATPPPSKLPGRMVAVRRRRPAGCRLQLYVRVWASVCWCAIEALGRMMRHPRADHGTPGRGGCSMRRAEHAQDARVREFCGHLHRPEIQKVDRIARRRFFFIQNMVD